MAEPWWVAFIRWHVATDHEWDVALGVEAMSMGLDGISRQIAEALSPVIEKAAAAVRAFIEALG